MKETELSGHSASGGVGLGRAVLLPDLPDFVPHHSVAPEERAAEQERFVGALRRSIQQLEGIVARAQLAEEYRLIFEAQLLFFSDPMILEDVGKRIADGHNAEWSVVESLEAFKKKLSVLDNQLIRERASDLDDVENRILANLMEIAEGDVRVPLLRELPPDAVLVADDISPSLMLHVRKAAGIAVARGGVTGHMAILARSRGIPAVVGVERLLENVHQAQEVLVDADRGVVILSPGRERLGELKRSREALERSAPDSSVQPLFELSDGTQAQLWANADDVGDVSDPALVRAFGIGLFRTEFIYLNQPGLFFMPEEQRDLYIEILRAAQGRPVTLRLLDLGDDKTVGSSFYNVVNLHRESLRSLRGIDFLLANPQLLRSQLQAILEAVGAVPGSQDVVRLLIPMVTGIEQMRQFREVLSQLAGELELSAEQIPVGVMLETPAACLMVDVLSKESDFFSVGTNDLAACLFALDRVQSIGRKNSLYQPALYRMLRDVVSRTKRPLSVCGETAAVPGLLAVLLGLGLRSFSVARAALPRVAGVLRSMDLGHAQELAGRVLEAEGEAEVQALLQRLPEERAAVP